MKHKNKCPHCAFMYAVQEQFKRAKTRKQNRKVFDRMIMSAVRVSGALFSRLDAEQQTRFLCDIIKESGSLATVKVSNGDTPKGPLPN
jgi:hypothetical protein